MPPSGKLLKERVTWCSFFYEERSDDEKEDYTSNWVRLLMAEMKKQFIKRVCEAPAVTQWIKIVEDRRTSMEDQSSRIPEKEFLLIHTHLVHLIHICVMTIKNNLC